MSIALSDTAGIGHVNVGLQLYRQFEALQQQTREPGQQLDFNRVIELAVPAVTNLALGLELRLKVHHFQLSGAYPRGHDIRELGSSFPPGTLDELRRYYLELYNNPQVAKGIEFRFSAGPKGREAKEWKATDFSTYDLAIEYIGPAYVKWRYVYELFGDDLEIQMTFAPLYFSAMAVHQAIRNHKGKVKVSWKPSTGDA